MLLGLLISLGLAATFLLVSVVIGVASMLYSFLSSFISLRMDLLTVLRKS